MAVQGTRFPQRQRSVVLRSSRRVAVRTSYSLATLFVIGAGIVAPGSSLFAARELPDLAPPPDPRPGEVTFGLGVTDREVSESLDTLFPLAVPKNGLLYFNPKLSSSDGRDVTVSIGLGYRQLLEGSNVIIGGNLFYDSFDSDNSHRINQFGAGVEVLSRWVDFRANYYLPEQNRRVIGKTQTMDISQKVSSSSQPLGPRTVGDTFSFQGNNILDTTSGFNQTLNTLNIRETETKRFWERYEAGSRGGDAEVGVLIPGLDRYAEVRLFGGYYYFNNEFGKDVNGFKGRAEVRALPAVTFDAAYYQDKEVIGSNWYFGMRVSATFDLANLANHKNPFAGFADSFKPKNPNADERAAFAERLTENVIRNSRAVTTQSNFIQVAEKKETYHGKVQYITETPFSTTSILTLNGAPITVTHVDSAAGAGAGTFESPYSTLTAANADPTKRDIVLLHANSAFTLQTITLAPGQQLLGDYANAVNIINSDKGLIELPHASAGNNAPTLSNVGGTVVNVVNNSVVSNLNLTGGAHGIFAAGGATGVTVTNSTISNMTTAGIEIKPSFGTTISNVTFNNNATDVILNAFNTTITNVTSNGAQNGAFDLSNTTGTTTITNVTVNNAGGFGLRITNPGGTHNIKNLDINNGTGAGVLIVGGGGTLNFDKNTSINNTGGAAFTLQGGTANVSYLGTMTESNNVPLIAVLAGHTGTATFQTGTLNATNGQGLLFDNADGHYNFLGTTTLHGGDAGIDIVNGSDGTFAFGAGTAITNPTGQGLFVNGGTANVTYAGSIAANASAAVEILNHATGTVDFSGSHITATGGTGLQFTNDSGTYKFLGTATLNGGDAGIDILSSNGTFSFSTGTSITNPTGTGFFLNGGQANVTYSGSITDNTGFALQVINHSVGTVAFNTGTVASTAGNGIQFTNDSGTYSVAKATVTNSTGAGLEVTASPTGKFTFGNVTTTTTAGPGIHLDNAGTVSVLGGAINGTGGDGVFSTNTALTLTGVSVGNNHALSIGGIGVHVVNNDGTARLVAISSDNIRSTGSGILTTDGGTAGELTLILNGNTLETLAAGSKAMSITGSALNSTTIRSMNGGTVIGNGTGGGLQFSRVTFDGDGATAGNQQVSGGLWNIGQSTSTRVFNDGVHLDGATGVLAFSTLNIFNNAGTGLFVDTKTLGTTFALGNTGGAIDTTAGAAMNLDPLTTNLTFTSVKSVNSGTSGVIVDSLTAGSTLTVGTTTVSGAAVDGVVVKGSAGSTLKFGTTTVTNVGDDGIDLSGAGNANVTFGTTVINGFGVNSDGVNFTGSDVTATFGKTTITNGGHGTGIDLSSTQNGRVITFLTGSSISQVAIGVQLSKSGTTATTANSTFQFGDGSGTDANGRNSIINAPTTVAAIGLNPASGTYNFQDVFFTGTAAFPAAPGAFFISATAVNGVGDGSFANPFSVHDADAITTTGITFAFLDGTYNFNTLNTGLAFSLGSGQSVTGLDNGNTVTFGTVQPANVSGNFGVLGGTAARQSGGSLSITNGAAASVFDLLGSNNVSNITVTGEGGVIDPTRLFASNGGAGGFNNAGGITFSGVTIGNVQAGSTAFDFTNMTGSVQASGNNINASGGTLLSVNGGTAAYTFTKGSGTLSGKSISIVNTTGGSVAVTGASLGTNGNTAVTLNGNAATVTLTNVAVTRTAGDTAYDIDATAASTGKVTVNGTSSIDSTAGIAFKIGAGARDIDASAMNFTNTGTTAANVISSTGQTGGTISFGNVGIAGYNNAAGTAVNLQGSGGTVSFADLDVATSSGAGVNVGAITFAPGSSSTITAVGAPALVMNGTTLSGGAATFVTVSGIGGANGISLTNVTGATTFGAVFVAVSTGDGIVLNNAGTVIINGGSINGTTGDGIHSVNTNLTVSGMIMGGVTIIGGDGIEVANTSGSHTVAINNTTIASATGAGFKVNGAGGGTTIITSLNGNTITRAGAGGIVVDTVTFDSDTVTAGIQQVAGGSTTIGSLVTTTNVAGDGLRLNNVLGSIGFGTLNIGNDTGTGLFIRDGGGKGGTFAFGTAGGAVNTTNGAAMDIDPVAFNVTFTSVGSTNAAAYGINLDTITGTANLGNVSVTNTAGTGIRIVGSSATITAGTVTVNGAATGLGFGNNTGSFTATGATSLTNITGTGINANAATGTYSFKGLTIGFSGAGRGIDFRGSNVQFETDTVSITGNGTAGSIAIDLSGTLNPHGANSATPNILLAKDAGETATISNVATGVKMGEPGNSAGAYFRFGNQTPLNSGSSIAVIVGGTTLDTTNLTSTNGFTQGRYEFLGVAFTGHASFEASPNFFFVAANATGTGDGSSVFNRANASTLVTDLNGNLLANKTIVLINDGNVISLGNNTATLNSLTNIDGFGNGNSVSAFTIPANVIIDTFTGAVADPTGNGAATITANAGNNVITLTGTHSIKNINITGGDFLVAGNGFTGLTVQGVGLTNGGSGVFSFTNATGVTTITNNTISQAGGRLLSVNGGTAAISLTAGTGSISNTGGSGVDIRNTGSGGSVTLTGVSVTGATATPLTFDNNKATFAITNSTFAVNAGVTLLNVDTGSGGSTTALNFDNTNLLTANNGPIAIVGAGARDIDLSASDFNVVGVTAANVISSTGQTGGTIKFGNIVANGYNNAAGTVVNLQGTSGTVTFKDLDVSTNAGAGLNVGAITFAPGSSPVINATGGAAVTMNGTTISGGSATFAGISAVTTGGAAGISLTNTVGTITVTTTFISGTGAASGIVLNNAGTFNILGGSIDGTNANGINSTNTTLTATGLTIGSGTAPAGNGIRVVNNDGTARVVTISNDNIKSVGDAIKTTDGGTAGELSLVLNGNTLQTTGVGSLAMNIAGSGLNSTTVNSFNGVTVTGNGTGGGILFNRVTFDAVTGGAIQQVTGGTANIGQDTTHRVAGNGLEFQGPTGDLAFGTLNIFNNAGTGLLVNTKALGTTFSNLSNTAGVVDTTNGAALNLDPLTVNLTFTSVSSTNAPINGVILASVSGTIALGNLSVTNATAAGLSMGNSNAAVTASSVTVNGAATGLLFGTNTGGSFTVNGATSLTNITGTGINAGSATGTYTFKGLTIGYSGNGRGLDLRNSNLQFETDTISITGNGTAGSIAIDLSGTQNPNGANSATPNILLAKDAGETASISNVAVGVKMGEPGNSAGAYFRFGNQTPTGSGGSGSSIAVIAGGTTLDTTNLTSTNGFTQGRYEFTGVAFTGSASFQASTTFFFVAANATGTGDGSSVANRANGATLLTALGANQLANETIVLINDGNVISIANTAALDANTNITSFANGNSVVAFTVPVNVIVDAFTGTVADPTGNGAATLTTAGGHNLISLNGGNSITNVNLSGGNFLISGSGSTGLTVTGSTLTSGATGVFSLTNQTGTVTITNNTISGGGSLLTVNGGSAAISLTKGTGTIANTGGSGVNIANTTAGSVTLTGLSVTGATATPLTFDNNKATFAITNSTFAVNSGVTLLNVDTGTGNSTSALTLDNTNTLTQISGTIAIIGQGSRNIDLSAFNFTNSGTTSANVISSTGQTGGTISFGNIGISSYNNAAGTAVNLQGTGGTVSFADLDIATTSGAGLSTGAITFAPGSSSTISTTGGTAVKMNGTTMSGGTATFASVSATNTGAGNAGINLANTVGTTTFTTVAISGTGTVGTPAAGILLNKAGTTNVLGGTIDGATANGIDSTNTTLTATGLTIGGTTAPTGNGVRVVNNDGTARLVTISNDNIKSVSDAIKTTDGGTAGELSLVLNGNTLQTTGVGSLAMNIVGSALNSTTVNSFNGVTVTGNGTGGGILFSRVTFDATTGGAIQQVTGGTANIGQDTTHRVAGNGLEFQGPTGDLTFGALNIFNNAGTGLLVNTKTLGTTFNLGAGGGTVDTTNGTALNLDPLTVNMTFSSVTSTNSATSGVILNTVVGTLALGNVSVTNATAAGLSMVASSATVTAGTVTVNGAATGLQFGANTGSFTASGATSLTNITGTGINANAATGTYSFQGVTIGFSGAGRGIDFRSSNLTSFQTGSITITGNGTAGSIGIDLSGSLYPGGQPVTNNAPNIKLATGAGQTAAISAVNTGVRLGDGTLGSAGAYLRYGNQTAGNSGSTIAVTAGGTTVDTGNLTSTSAFQQGRYEFTGVIFTGQATFEGANPNFIFVGTNAAGSANGSNPSNRISTATFLASDNTSAFLAGKTVIFVNDNVAGIDLGATTLNLGAGTTLAGFGNSASITVPGGVQPANVIGDNFVASGGTFSDAAGAATVHSNTGVTTLTLNTGNTLSNFILGNGGTSISGSAFGTLTVNGMVVNNTTGGAISLTTGALAGTGFNSVTSGAGANGISLTSVTGTMNFGSGAISGSTAAAFLVNGGSAALTYSGSLTNTAGRSVSLQNITGGSVTLSGNISDTGTGLLVQNNTGGTFTFSGTTKTLSTGTNQAVTLATNTGATISFTNGGLGITTTSGAGFGATGGGTVGVSGTGNTITTTTGTGLNLNGVAIATTGFTLQSVSSNGAVNGIALTSLTGGGVVGVQVTGTGSTAGSGGTIQNTTGAAVSLTTLGSLGGGVTLNNMNITGGGGILGTNFGTLAVTNDSVSATGNAALSLTTGTITAGSTFSVLSSSGSATNGVLLSGVAGSFSATTGTITNAAGASWSVVGGTVSATYSGGITQGNNAALVSVTGGHATGTITFDTGTLSATSGTGLQFDNADGTYNFNGTTTLNGGDAGIDILNGSSGTFSFNANTSITNPTGTGFTANGSTANVTYSGNITKSGASAGLLVDITNESAGTITFQTGTLSSTSTAGTGINLNNADGTVNFNGTTTLNGGNSHVDINTGSGGTISFATGTTITSSSGTAFVFNGSTAGVTYSGSITQANNALMVDITNQASGTITFQTGTLSASSGTGINLNNVDGTVNFNGTTTLNGGNAHIDINTGSAGTIAFSSGTSVGATTAPTGVAFREDTSTANVTYNGTLRQTNAANAVSINAKTGGTTAFTGAITASTGAANAITLTANTGGTINFTGGLSLTTTSGVGFNATGGGTVSATQNNTTIVNTISSTTGTALNIANTTIGASGVTFRSISANGGTNGIVLNTTGATGGLTVTGTGSTAGSGGTIQNTVQGALFTSTSNLSLSNMNFTNPNSGNGTVNNVDTSTFNSAAQAGINMSGVSTATFTNLSVTGGGGAGGAQVGINGQNVSNLSIINSTVTGFGDAVGEGDVKLWNLSGTSVVTNSTFGFVVGDATGGENLFEVRNTTGTLTLTVTGSTFQNTRDSASGSGGLAFTSTGTAIFNLNASHNTFSNLKTSGIEGIAKQTSTMNVNITDGGTPGSPIPGNGNTFDPGTGTGRAIGLSAQDTAALNFNINRNVAIKGSGGPVINIFSINSAVVNGRIDNNADIENNAPTANRAGSPISLSIEDKSTAVIEIANNTINNAGQDSGISAFVQGDGGVVNNTASLDVSITGNTINLTGLNITTANNFNNGILVSSGASNNDATTVYLNVQNNAVTGITGPNGNAGLAIENTGGAGSHFYMQGFTTSPTNTWNIRGNTPAGSVVQLNSGTAPAVAAIPAGHNGGVVSTPSNANALLFAPSGSASALDGNGVLTQAALNTLGSAAISLWASSGLSAQQLSLLQSVTFGISDLPAGYLGEALPGQILISATAAGQAWFIDTTPFDNSEFTGSGTKLTALGSGPAAGRVDLLTVILHEFDHELGGNDTYAATSSSNLMYGYLGAGERRLPAVNQALGLSPHSGGFADALTFGREPIVSTTLTLPSTSLHVIANPGLPAPESVGPLKSFRRESIMIQPEIPASGFDERGPAPVFFYDLWSTPEKQKEALKKMLDRGHPQAKITTIGGILP